MFPCTLYLSLVLEVFQMPVCHPAWIQMTVLRHRRPTFAIRFTQSISSENPHKHTHTHAHAHACTHNAPYTHTHACARTHARARTHKLPPQTHTHTYIYIYIYTHTHYQQQHQHHHAVIYKSHTLFRRLRAVPPFLSYDRVPSAQAQTARRTGRGENGA